jgi:acetylornithine deacetylase/succinyl-diaminopimelate desuccinylase-like protein
VAVLTDLLCQLAETGQRPRRTLKVVMIANEESNEVEGIGLQQVAREGKLKDLANEPVYWLDSANFGPTLGTAAISIWELKVKGVGGHSGMPQNCVNALELGMATSLALSEWFAKTFPPRAEEHAYRFLSPSTLKATVVDAPNAKENVIPGEATLRGDIRVTPFYELAEVRAGVERFVRELNERIQADDPPPSFPRTKTEKGQRGTVSLTFPAGGMEGIACRIDSPGLKALQGAIEQVRGEAPAPFSVMGSLPLVRDLQREGCDVQITGFGDMAYYHAPNEQARLGDFRQGFAILRELLVRLG